MPNRVIVKGPSVGGGAAVPGDPSNTTAGVAPAAPGAPTRPAAATAPSTATAIRRRPRRGSAELSSITQFVGRSAAKNLNAPTPPREPGAGQLSGQAASTVVVRSHLGRCGGADDLLLKACRRVGVAGVLAIAGLLVGSLVAVPGSADTDPGLSPVQFTTCGSSLWTVPEGVTSVTADVFGAAGGSGSVMSGGTRGPGGAGGEALGTFAVTPGEVLQVNVGCAGVDANANTPGAGGRGGNNDANGGNGVAGVNFSPFFTATGGGGGASDIRQGGTALSNRVIVGGGGGGSGDAEPGSTGAAGGSGGFPAGQPGGGTGSAPSSCAGGGGGTQSAGGTGGATSGYCATAGIASTGPNGADGVSSGFFASGPGGGGYNGGGSGATEFCSSGVAGGGAGGGGANFFAPNVTNQLSLTGSEVGAQATGGRVVILFDAPVVVRFTC